MNCCLLSFMTINSSSAMGRPSIASTRVEEILEAFEFCVIEKGLDKTTLVDIAERSGLPRSLVRHFIGNRADLEAKLIDHEFATPSANRSRCVWDIFTWYGNRCHGRFQPAPILDNRVCTQGRRPTRMKSQQ